MSIPPGASSAASAPLVFDAVLEHFHARDDIPRMRRRAFDIARQSEADARQCAEAPRALGNLFCVDVHTDGLAKISVNQRHERSVAAAVIEQPSPGVLAS